MENAGTRRSGVEGRPHGKRSQRWIRGSMARRALESSIFKGKCAGESETLHGELCEVRRKRKGEREGKGVNGRQRERWRGDRENGRQRERL